MDVVAEYARYYGGVPADGVSWWAVCGLAARTGRFTARDILAATRAVSLAIAPLGGEASAGQAQMDVAQLQEQMRA